VGTLLLLQAMFTYLPAMQQLFGTERIDGAVWTRIVLFGSAVFFIVELEK
jgi:hypothetical protein